MEAQLLGQWDIRPESLGNMSDLTVFYNSSVNGGILAREGIDFEGSAAIRIENATWNFERCQLRCIGMCI